MVALPKPRGLWDYVLGAVLMSGLFLLLFWIDATRGIGSADAALAVAAGILFAGFVILTRRDEKAAWLRRTTIVEYALGCFAAFSFIFGFTYTDAYFLQHEKITRSRLWHDLLFAVLLSALLGWNSRERFRKHPGRAD